MENQNRLALIRELREVADAHTEISKEILRLQSLQKILRGHEDRIIMTLGVEPEIPVREGVCDNAIAQIAVTPPEPIYEKRNPIITELCDEIDGVPVATPFQYEPGYRVNVSDFVDVALYF